MTALKVIFVDLDGTLADSMPLLYQLYYDVLKGLGKVGSQQEFNQFIGPKITEIAESMVKKHNLTISAHTLALQYHSKLRRLYRKVPLTNGALDFLKFSKANGWHLALVTSAEEELAHDFLSFHEITSYFDKISTAKGLLHSKPDPAIYKRALNEMGVVANEAIAIEDSQSGIKSAEGAGIETLHFGEMSWEEIIAILSKTR